jgi:hypothetical protein
MSKTASQIWKTEAQKKQEERAAREAAKKAYLGGVWHNWTGWSK